MLWRPNASPEPYQNLVPGLPSAQHTLNASAPKGNLVPGSVLLMAEQQYSRAEARLEPHASVRCCVGGLIMLILTLAC